MPGSDTEKIVFCEMGWVYRFCYFFIFLGQSANYQKQVFKVAGSGNYKGLALWGQTACKINAKMYG